jgi:S-formylglutathione hydrolase FrmB
MLNSGSWFVNSRAGCFEDLVMHDVWPFVQQQFSIRPEKDAHLLAGASMGGFSVFNLGIKYRSQFGALVGVFPLVNWRYCDCHGNYHADFDPNCTGYQERYRPWALIGRLKVNWLVYTVRQRTVFRPLYSRREAPERIRMENPVEMLTAYGVQPGELKMFLGYVDNDEFNTDAQVESFLHVCDQLGLRYTALKMHGRHHKDSALKMLPTVAAWLQEHLGPYAPLHAEPAGEKASQPER